jgi:predicted oxidoreductase (fatty acid repression mutant protein)
VNRQKISAQWQTVGWVAAGCLALNRREYGEAIKHFRKVSDPEVTAKFFVHWIWRLTAQLETGNAWLLSGNICR